MRFHNIVSILLTTVAIKVSCECGIETNPVYLPNVNGTAAYPGSFPWSIHILRKFETGQKIQDCMGTLISPSVVVSSANCFYDETSNIKVDAHSFTAVAKGSTLEEYFDFQELKVESIHIADGYQGSRGFYAKNIAWLTLEHPFNVTTSTVRPVCIDFDNQHESEELQIGRVGKIIHHWLHEMYIFTLNPSGPIAITVISYGECVSKIPQEFGNYLTTDKFCGSYPQGTLFRTFQNGAGVHFQRNGRWYFRGILNRELLVTGPSSENRPLIFTNVGQFVDEMNRSIYIKKCGKVTRPVTPTIREGLRAELGGFPWHVAIYRKNSTGYHDQICGGSLISSNVVISAAHCFYDDRIKQKMDATNYAVAAGKHYRSYHWPEKFVQKSPVETIHISSRYYGVDGLYAVDIAWLILQSPFNVTPFVTPICLHSNYQHETQQLQIGQIGKVAGWGLTADGFESNELQEMNVPFIAHADCVSSLPQYSRPYVTFDKFCAGYLNGTQLCEGDSGGGLVFERDGRWYLRGIVSVNPQGGISCNTNSYTAFTDVGRFNDELYIFTNITTNDII